jgi:hypothetical protein
LAALHRLLCSQQQQLHPQYLIYASLQHAAVLQRLQDSSSSALHLTSQVLNRGLHCCLMLLLLLQGAAVWLRVQLLQLLLHLPHLLPYLLLVLPLRLQMLLPWLIPAMRQAALALALLLLLLCLSALPLVEARTTHRDCYNCQ